MKDIDIAKPATDEAIWDYAKANNCCIVTNDGDFQNILLKKGFPPKLILLRTGNQRTEFIGDVLEKHIKDVKALEISIDYGLSGIPETFFVNRQGQVRRKWIGPFTEPALRAFLDELVGAP